MKKIISFDKSLDFKSMIGDISSISLDHDLKFIDGSNITGNFLISGSYKLTEASRLEDKFKFKIPVEIVLNEVLDLNDCSVDIEDFTYRVENDDTLVCHIEVKVEGVEEVLISEEVNEEVYKVDHDINKKLEDENIKIDILNNDKVRECDGDMKPDNLKKDDNIKAVEDYSYEEENTTTKTNTELDANNNDSNINNEEENTTNNAASSLFSSLSDSDETYSTYSVYIVRENDNVEYIMNKYKVSREELENYNDLNNLDIGSKIIIPTADERD